MSREVETPAPRYEADVAAWAEAQAAAIRERRWTEVDAEHVAEEIEDLARSDRRALHSRMRRLLQHLLKLRHQPERARRSWQATVVEQRARIARILRDSPSLRSPLEAVIAEEYPAARELAAIETDLPIETFPEACPFTLDEILEGDRPRGR